MTESPAAGLTDEHSGSAQVRLPPQRTCVGCRRRGDRSVLLRLVVQEVDGARAVVLDRHRRMPGRGLWLHPDEHCLELARRRTALARALRTQGRVDTTAVLATVSAVLQDGARRRVRSLDEANQRPCRPSARARPIESGQNADDHPMSTQR